MNSLSSIGSTGSHEEQKIDPSPSPSGLTFSCFSHIGNRKTQEDRYVACGDCIEPKKSAFFGVFDGTVGDFASENVKEIMVRTLLQQPSWKELAEASKAQTPQLLERALADAYRDVDHELLRLCSANSNHYATCTSVTVAVVGDFIAVAHIGDSRVILGSEEVGEMNGTGEMNGKSLTRDHEPHLPEERERIEQNGGAVERLKKHGNKPYIRGGDFMMRKALGEQPMQLQYSRAFGCKDLKVFGLTAVPEIYVFKRERSMKTIILGSDGIWGVVSPKEAATLARHAPSRKLNPAEAVVRYALRNNAAKKVRSDNVTAVVIAFD